MTAAQLARTQVAEMTGKTPETVSALRLEDGVWIVHVDVVEMRRMPDTTDRMATYEIQLRGGEVVSLRRVHRFVRTWIGDHN